MSEFEKQRTRPHPSRWVRRFSPLITPNCRVLDLAAGSGRHSLLALEHGANVTAVDIDISAMKDLQDKVELIEADLENGRWPLADRHFDVVIVTNYLHRALFPNLLETLAENGLLIYETFMEGNEKIGRPRSPDFLLKSGELLTRLLPDFQILAYEQGHVVKSAPSVGAPAEKIIQRVAAKKGQDPVTLSSLIGGVEGRP